MTVLLADLCGPLPRLLYGNRETLLHHVSTFEYPLLSGQSRAKLTFDDFRLFLCLNISREHVYQSAIIHLVDLVVKLRVPHTALALVFTLEFVHIMLL